MTDLERVKAIYGTETFVDKQGHRRQFRHGQLKKAVLNLKKGTILEFSRWDEFQTFRRAMYAYKIKCYAQKLVITVA